MSSKLGLNIENGIIQTANGLISSFSWPPIKKFFYEMLLKGDSKVQIIIPNPLINLIQGIKQ